MTRLRLLVPLFGLSAAIAVACSDSGSSPNPGSAGEGTGGGAAGEQSNGGGTAGSMSNGGASAGETSNAGAAGEGIAGEAGAGPTDCTGGQGKLTITVKGLPAGVDADVLLSGADDLLLTMSDTIPDATAGNYEVKASRVFDADPIVRTAFDATVKNPSFCLTGGGSQTVEVTYAPIPSSNKLWMPSGVTADLIAYGSESLGATATKPASVSIKGPGSKSIAFDQDGNLWALGPTVADPMIVRFKASNLGASGTRTPDIKINMPEIECVPAINSIAFDADGNLWVSACGGEVHRLAAADLKTSGDKMSDVLFTGLTTNEGLAFDKAGNLWVGGGPALERYDASRLGTSSTDPGDLELKVTAADNNAAIKANYMAFDQAGNLWGLDQGPNMVFEVTESALGQTGSKSVKAEHGFVVSVTALPAAPAFDEGNGLWLSLTTGKFGRLSPEQLPTTAGLGAPVTPATVITSADADTQAPMAFFPAPAGLPLYHAIPAP